MSDKGPEGRPGPAPAPAPGPGEGGPAGSALGAGRALADDLAGCAAGTVEAILMYGSHLLGASPDPNSALDFVVVVSGYRPFYQALHDVGEMHRRVGVLVALARVLPPNVIAFTPGDGARGIAKCLVVSRQDLLAALGPAPRDHFLLGRLVQKVALVWSPDGGPVRWLDQALDEARRGVLAWVGPYLDEPFDAEAVGRRLLEVCYRGELRPEARDRSATIFDTQREHFRHILEPVLAGEAAAGRLLEAPDGYRFANPRSPSRKRMWDRHFRRSKVRATARWLKHVVTFDNWLPYVHRKAERRLGTTITLTRLERRWPLVFLWPRAVRILLSRPEQEAPARALPAPRPGEPPGASP